ncbi:Protein-S-isoprenylcysteine O-methyltransferase Ste14 [Lutimaribacter pacificus]|uniref:Protein-S-isoprenylcysteine O-methyltransferase Ste14 n=1 Tax=Lutimaribacter pacificus TaxID=391948 RepID=A0A1H0N5N7_9RHOB|nr:methyltransferase [Lutimaribacter pacificus]SDO88029.1 Protein-S-isoprenylcysteine O-methyltransferase Ste14 [Lutimaribacter pacificus]SHK86883.1 Protein-S-isoprenylcysteine O-methyltransferase Ste14 [Lutimaribacter pacificus]
MLELDLPEALMLALRWLLLLGPICLVLFFAFLRDTTRSAKIGGLFAFLYGIPLIFITHSLALHFGWWRYGWDALMLNGIPVDILIGGAILFGPGLFFAFPKVGPLMICLPIIVGLHATLFSSLKPLVHAGPFWFGGVVLVFVTAHIPAIYLAKWTAEDRRLPMRCALLALMTGGMIFVVLPSLIMQAMGGEWELLARPPWSSVVAGLCLATASVIGLAANQMLCLQGGGTPIPLDPTKRLVRSGIYSYVSNPMQLSAALCWIILGVFLQNVWVIAAAGMAWVFVQGMVRWHHRHDLLKRFPEGWPEYKANVPEWIPRWRPWVPSPAHATLREENKTLLRILGSATGLDIEIRDGATKYQPAQDPRHFTGIEARLFAVTHVNFAWAVAAHAALLVVMATKYMMAHLRQPEQVRT